jgi:hypothetical protein
MLVFEFLSSFADLLCLLSLKDYQADFSSVTRVMAIHGIMA